MIKQARKLPFTNIKINNNDDDSNKIQAEEKEGWAGKEIMKTGAGNR